MPKAKLMTHYPLAFVKGIPPRLNPRIERTDSFRRRRLETVRHNDLD